MRTTKYDKIKHVIYFSKPTLFSEKTTDDILEISRKNNNKTNVTGALICRSDLYFQFLEGPIEAVEKTFQKIKLDTRHLEINLVKEDKTTRRLFASKTKI